MSSNLFDLISGERREKRSLHILSEGEEMSEPIVDTCCRAQRSGNQKTESRHGDAENTEKDEGVEPQRRNERKEEISRFFSFSLDVVEHCDTKLATHG